MDVHYFAAARAAAGVPVETVTAPATLGDLLDGLAATHTGATEAGTTFAEVLKRCTFLIDGHSATRDTSLAGAARVDVLPPFAGG